MNHGLIEFFRRSQREIFFKKGWIAVNDTVHTIQNKRHKMHTTHTQHTTERSLAAPVVPHEQHREMAPSRPLRLVWWLRSEGWADASWKQMQRVQVAAWRIRQSFVSGN